MKGPIPAVPGQFIPVLSSESIPENDPNCRIIVGDGTPYLRAPGLKELDYIKCGALELRLKEEVSYPMDPEGKRQDVRLEDMLHVSFAENSETPVILRSVRSNDGIWQKGEMFEVYGEWDVKKSPKDKPAATAAATGA